MTGANRILRSLRTFGLISQIHLGVSCLMDDCQQVVRAEWLTVVQELIVILKKNNMIKISETILLTSLIYINRYWFELC